MTWGRGEAEVNFGLTSTGFVSTVILSWRLPQGILRVFKRTNFFQGSIYIHTVKINYKEFLSLLAFIVPPHCGMISNKAIHFTVKNKPPQKLWCGNVWRGFGYSNMFPHDGKQLIALTKLLLKAFVPKVACFMIFKLLKWDASVSSSHYSGTDITPTLR